MACWLCAPETPGVFAGQPCECVKPDGVIPVSEMPPFLPESAAAAYVQANSEALLSIAVSLRRIADALAPETGEHPVTVAIREGIEEGARNAGEIVYGVVRNIRG